MTFLQKIILFNLIVFSFVLTAQDYGPVKVDLEGYIDDRGGETIKAEEVDLRVEAPVKKEVKKVDPVEARKERRRVAPVAPTNSGPITKVDSNSLTFSGAKSTGPGNLYLYIGIGVGLLIIIAVVVIIMKKKAKNSPYKIRENTATLAEKIEENEKQLMAETQMEETDVNPNVGQEHFVPHTSEEMAAQVAYESKVDERGRNPSGLIIDEDKYFATGAQGFVDEDFDPTS